MNGFNITSDLYRGQLCIQDKCKITEFYAAKNVSADTQLYNYIPYYGTIGFGLKSAFWEAYTVPSDLGGQAIYSISFNDEGNANLTLGGFNETYDGDDFLFIQSNDESSKYNCTNLTFGQIYYDQDVESSAYFAPLQAEQSEIETIFSISFAGLGLPRAMYAEYTRLLLLYNYDFHCDSWHGQCHIPGQNCSQV